VRNTDYLQGMVVAMDPTSGDVRALVGGRDYSDSQFDRAVDGMRQPGSSFKPIVYAAAIADSIPPNALFADTALAITLPTKRSTGRRTPTASISAPSVFVMRWRCHATSSPSSSA
jgi:membrane carboxypeptidase/penicillin-binding protein